MRAAAEVLARLKAGARREEIDVARARLAAADAQIATLEKSRRDATVAAPAGGIVTQKLVEQGELIAPRTPLSSSPTSNVVGQRLRRRAVRPARRARPGRHPLHRRRRAGIAGTVTFISPKAEFTPRNVQTAEERSKLVFRIKVTVDNRDGVLKQGMPVEAEIALAPSRR